MFLPIGKGTTEAPPPAIKVQTRPIRFNNVNFKDAPENDWISWWNPNWLAWLDKFQFISKMVVWFFFSKKQNKLCWNRLGYPFSKELLKLKDHLFVLLGIPTFKKTKILKNKSKKRGPRILHPTSYYPETPLSRPTCTRIQLLHQAFFWKFWTTKTFRKTTRTPTLLAKVACRFLGKGRKTHQKKRSNNVTTSFKRVTHQPGGFGAETS